MKLTILSASTFLLSATFAFTMDVRVEMSKEKIEYIAKIGRRNDAQFRYLAPAEKEMILSFYPAKLYEQLKLCLVNKIGNTGFHRT